mgnify:CR=1 FL=1
MEDLFHTAVEYTVMAIVGIIGWIGKTLHGKANKSEVEKLEEELQRLREKVFSLLETLATKEDFNKLERKLDKLIDREIDRGRSRR